MSEWCNYQVVPRFFVLSSSKRRILLIRRGVYSRRRSLRMAEVSPGDERGETSAVPRLRAAFIGNFASICGV